jgi:hypothetical protein
MGCRGVWRYRQRVKATGTEIRMAANGARRRGYITASPHLVDLVLVLAIAERPARQVQELPRIFRGLKQARDHAWLEVRDPRCLGFQFQDAGLDATGPGFAVGVLPCRGLDPRAPEHREQSARRLGRGTGCARPCGDVVFAGELLARLLFSALSTAASRAFRPGGRC